MRFANYQEEVDDIVAAKHYLEQERGLKVVALAGELRARGGGGGARGAAARAQARLLHAPLQGTAKAATTSCCTPAATMVTSL